jgi:fumarate hydratase subunit alpha
MSKIKMLNPTASEDDIINFVCETVKSAGGRPCPPLVIGVGIGGSFDYAAFLSKKALIREGAHHDESVAALEDKILNTVNQTGVGPQGLGGKTTALKVAVETYPTHIASLPVAVNISCHVTRHAECII